jgi:hypothetical protein
MKMLEHGRVSKYLHASHQDYDHILACIPDEMTASELNAVQHHLELKGLAETILFDDNIDLDGYIQSVTQSHYKSRQTNDYEKPDLDLSCISYFVGLISEDSFSDPTKKKRIVKLLDAACKAEIDVNKLKITDVWALAERLKVPAFTFKHIACLRGEALEDALGL